MARRRSSPQGVVRCPACGHAADPSAGAVNFCPACGVDLRAPEPSRSAGFVHRVIADRYRLVALLGEGGMGAVYRAEHIRMGKALALKILRGDFARQPGAAARFLSEAKIVSRLSHPHTIAVFDFGEIDGEGAGLYLAMEYVPGKDLATVLRESGPLPERRVADLGQQILGSLAEAHDAGIVHRDMKPGNVMLMRMRSDDDFVKVLDFGIAKLWRVPAEGAGPGGPDASASTTSEGAIVGTPSYLAPEQARGDAVDARADLYAVGCLLYELVSGEPPFAAPSPMAVVAAHLHDEPRLLTSAVPGVSRAFAEVIHRALRKRPEERFPSADAMREALAEASEPTRSRPLTGRGADVDGVGIARREDFAGLDPRVPAPRRGGGLALATLAVVVAAGGLLAWRWADAYALLAARLPALAAALPQRLRPAPAPDGEEHEPNDDPAHANLLVLPPGPDGRPAGGVAVVHGSVGARRSDVDGDVDFFRIEIPAVAGRKVLVAEWRGERSGEGIHGLDVALALNRERPQAGGLPGTPLVAVANREGPGRPERLVALVEQGTYYLSVREVHDDATGPVEKPSDRYRLTVRLADPPAGEELEPNDGPEPSGRPERYADWRAVAERNVLGEAAPVRGDTAPDDPDLFAVAARREGEAPELIVAVPDPGLALAARLWRPDAEDLAPTAAGDRVRLEPAGSARAGEVLVLPLRPPPPAGEPALLELRGAEGRGRYVVVALGPGAASVAAVKALAAELTGAGRPAEGAAVARAFDAAFPEKGDGAAAEPAAAGTATVATPDPTGTATGR